MEQHPVPQNISSYEFRLVGDMTLKQFFLLAGGILFGFILIRLPLPGLIKYPFAILSAAMGAITAFVPINGRPSLQWLSAFFHAVYSPTEYYWSPTPAAASPASVQTAFVPTAPFAPDRQPDMPPPPLATPPPKPDLPPLPPLPPPIIPPPSPDTGPPLVSTTATKPSLAASETLYTKGAALPPQPPPKPAPPPVPAPEPREKIVFTPAQAPAPAGPPPPLPAVSVPQGPGKTGPAVNVAKPAPTTTQIDAPSRPNLLVGLVTDPGGQTLDGVIVEITNSQTGIPARALRTNRLGQFQIATPLAPGGYTVLAEKEGYSFEPVSITAADSIIPPVHLVAQPV